MLVLMLLRASSRVSGFPVASPCLYGGSCKTSPFSKVSKQVVMSFCVGGAALCDIPICLITCRKSFCVAGAILLRRFQKMSCSFRGRRCTAHVSALDTPHSTRYTLHFTLHTLHSTLYTPHSTLHTSHSTLHTLRFRLHTPHSTFYLHCTLHTPQSTLYTLHSTLYTPHSTL